MCICARGTGGRAARSSGGRRVRCTERGRRESHRTSGRGGSSSWAGALGLALAVALAEVGTDSAVGELDGTWTEAAVGDGCSPVVVVAGAESASAGALAVAAVPGAEGEPARSGNEAGAAASGTRR